MDIIRKVWAEDPIIYNGKYYKRPYPDEEGMRRWPVAARTRQYGAPGEVDEQEAVHKIRRDTASKSITNEIVLCYPIPLASSFRGYEGQRHRKRRPLVRGALDVDDPTVGCDDFAHYVQFQACPCRVCAL